MENNHEVDIVEEIEPGEEVQNENQEADEGSFDLSSVIEPLREALSNFSIEKAVSGIRRMFTGGSKLRVTYIFLLGIALMVVLFFSSGIGYIFSQRALLFRPSSHTVSNWVGKDAYVTCPGCPAVPTYLSPQYRSIGVYLKPNTPVKVVDSYKDKGVKLYKVEYALGQAWVLENNLSLAPIFTPPPQRTATPTPPTEPVLDAAPEDTSIETGEIP